MKLYLVTNDGELLETWQNVEKDWLYSQAMRKHCAMEVSEAIERHKDTDREE